MRRRLNCLFDRVSRSAKRCRAARMFADRSAVALVLTSVLLASVTGGVSAQTPQPGSQSATIGRATAACVIAPKPNSLWSLAQCCAKDLKSNPGCRYYNKADEFIILKDNDPIKPAAFLMIPAVKVTGIEDKQIFDRPFVDFWAYGWQEAQTYIKKPAAETALAINSASGRTQDQLHIHIACIRPDVAQALADDDTKIGTDPVTAVQLQLGPDQHIYRVVRAITLVGSENPYNLVAQMPGAKDDMADESIAVVGSQTPGSFYVLETYAHGTNPGSAEELLDQFCGY